MVKYGGNYEPPATALIQIWRQWQQYGIRLEDSN